MTNAPKFRKGDKIRHESTDANDPTVVYVATRVSRDGETVTYYDYSEGQYAQVSASCLVHA